MKKTGTARRILSIAMVLMMMLSLCTVSIQSVFAESEPAPIQDTYEIDGVTYFKVDSDAFATSPTQYLLDLMRKTTPKLSIEDSNHDFNSYWSCIADSWLYLGAGILKLEDTANAAYLVRARAIEHAIASGAGTVSGNGSTATGKRILNSIDLEDGNKQIQNYYSFVDAEKAVYSEMFGNASLQSSKGNFQNDSTEQTVLLGGAYAETSGESKSKVGMAMYFSDFKVIPLLPEDNGINYIQSKTKSVTDSDIIASNVRNLTPSSITASQSVSRSATDTLSSTISGSKSYTYSKGVEVSVEKDFKAVGFKIGGKVSVSASKSISNGWSKSESASASDSSSQSVSVSLPPYTNVMLKQKNTTEEWLTKYNCPVALQYATTIVLYDNDGNVINAYNFGSDAREDLYNRAVVNAKINDKEGIERSYLYRVDEKSSLAAIDLASTYVPMSSTGGSFTETVDSVETSVESILPIYPLYKVKVRAPNVSYISDETYSYGSYNYLNTDMYIGDFSYTNYMAFDAFNKYNVEYYGFSKDFGHWVVADKDGNERTGDDAPVVLEKDPVSKNTMYTAVNPGVCYIKYVIDEDVYNTADNPDVYTKNSDLNQTAAVRIKVLEKPFSGTINVSGSFTGYVNDQPKQLDADGRLMVDICDDTGKEIVKPYVWEQKELSSKGITVDGNMVSFSKTGTFHVRAVSGDLRSDWVEITVVEPNDVQKAEAEAEKAQAAANEAQAAADAAKEAAQEKQAAADVAKKTAQEKQAAVDAAKKAAEEKAKDEEKNKEAEQKPSSDGSSTKTVKKANTLSVAGKTTTVKYSTLKKKAQTRSVSKIISFKNKGQGTKAYTLYTAKKGSTSYKKYFAVNKSNGKLTIKKGLRKGTYTLKVKVKAAGNSNYKATGWKTVTVKVKVG